jgi:hypothetical protein
MTYIIGSDGYPYGPFARKEKPVGMPLAERARECAAEIIAELAQQSILPIPLVDLENLEDKVARIIRDNFAGLSHPTYVPVVLRPTEQTISPPLSLSNVRRSRNRILVRFALRMLLSQERQWV